MRIELTPLLDGNVSEISVEYSYTPDDRGVLLPEEIHLLKPVCVRCHVADHHGYLTLDATGSVSYETPCARCLQPVVREMTFSIERMIESGNASHLPEAEHDEEYEDDLLPMVNGGVEIDPELTEALVLELPMYHLCREDCPGLCPKCGKPLADGECGCNLKKEIDPRLAILQKLLEKPE